MMLWNLQPGLHIILGDVLNPFIRQHLYVMTEQKILEKVFAFVEDLVTNEDEYISNAIYFESWNYYCDALEFVEKLSN